MRPARFGRAAAGRKWVAGGVRDGGSTVPLNAGFDPGGNCGNGT
ncbi:MAG: hypothetical protein ACYC8T_28495 [Myxococcaceae bacterium]